MKCRSSRTSVLRRNILRLYTVTLIASCLAIGFYIDQGWNVTRAHAIADLEKDATLSAQIIDDGVKDAGKLLGITKFRIEERLRRGGLTRQQAHDLLKESISNFILYNENQSFGLLVYLDREGVIVAQNGIYPAPPYYLGDRLYFRLLQENPSKKYSVGNLVKARTTGKLVFHMAMPVHGPDNLPAGAIVQQISEEEIAVTLGKIIRNPGEKVMELTSSGEAAFIFPLPPNPDELREISFPRLLKLIAHLGKSSGWVKIPGGITELQETVYAGYLFGYEDGICSVVTLRESEIYSLFMNQYRKELGISLLIIFVISVLFISLHRQSRNLDDALSDSQHDQLTGIANRYAAEEVCTRIWGDALRRQEALSVLFIDIDHFKLLNDTWGHDTGDMVLKAVADSIRRSLQRPLDFCCRWGGEEFVAILPDTGKEAAQRIANTILNRIRELHLSKGGKPLPMITISIGVATSQPEHTEDKERLFSRADSAMLKAKMEGRNHVVLD